MKFNNHSNFEGLHAFLSASKYSWIRYDNEKLINTFRTHTAAQRGTDLHNFAAEAIRLKIRMAKSRLTLNMFVNDALGFRMTPEQVLFYSPVAFGTADAVSFRKERGASRHILRIHDLKTGETKSSFDQLKIYAAFFCLEYNFKPHEIDIELRIYQSDEVLILSPEPTDIVEIMSKTVTFTEIIEQIRQEESD